MYTYIYICTYIYTYIYIFVGMIEGVSLAGAPALAVTTLLGATAQKIKGHATLDELPGRDPVSRLGCRV